MNRRKLFSFLAGESRAMKPQRIQRKRTRGWRMPENTVYVGRGTMWGNYEAKRRHIKDNARAVEVFRQWVDEGASWAWKGRARIGLRGKNLACWCPLVDKDGNAVPCHADVLLELANEPPN
jgi:hypothetical protein